MKKKYIFICFTVLIFFIASIPLLKTISTEANKEAEIIEISMSGFSPNELKLKEGKEYEFKLVNLDNSHHSDGGGWHQFASDELDFDYKIAPESTQSIKLKVDKKGEYVFYCDVCCGGKENPSMQGKIIVD